jgi:phosphoglycerol transferase MdoB-like AlkP superfamily enzyme
VGALGGDKRLMPRLSEIAESGILMDHCFAVGHRTAQGLCGTLAGFPDLPGSSVITTADCEGCFLTLGSILKPRGYETIFMHGGQAYFDHKKAFCGSNGYSRLIFEHELPCKTFRTVAGWCDEDLFSSIDKVAKDMGDRPFLISALTVSFHRPFAIPAGKIAPVDPSDPHGREMDCLRYTDRCIGLFMEQARKSRYFNNTIFVFTADHIGAYMQDPMVPGSSFRVPFIIYAPSIAGPARRVSTVCSQTDITPTTLSLLGGRYEHCFFGSSVLDRPPQRGMALMRAGDNQLMFAHDAGDVLLLPPFAAAPRLYHFSIPARIQRLNSDDPLVRSQIERLETDALSLLQAAQVLYRRHSYHLRTPAAPAQARGG